MKRLLILFLALLLVALASNGSLTAPPLDVPETYLKNQPSVDPNITPEVVVAMITVNTAPANSSASTLLYISGTTHIESKPQT
jgi:hypothetical protein